MYNALSSVIGGGRGAQQEHLALRDVVPHVAACGPHQRSSQILFVSQKRLFQQYLPKADSLAPMADAGVGAAVRSTTHRPVVAGFQKRNRNPTVGAMLLRWRKPKANPPFTCVNMIPE